MKLKLLFLLFTICCYNISLAQLIEFSPDFPSETSNITITYNAALGSGGLKDCACDVYMHTGVITDKSTGAADWKYVKHPWATTFADIKLTSLGNNKHQITINNPRAFYGVPANEKILKVTAVFRNATGTREGKNKDNSDIFIPVYDANALNVKFTSPAQEPKFEPVTETISKTIGERLQITAISSKTANMVLYLNDVIVSSANNVTSLSADPVITTSGLQVVKVRVTEGANIQEKSFTFLVNGNVTVEDLPAGTKDGVTFLNNGTSAIFNLYAPGKNNVYVIGDFNNWQGGTTSFMKKTTDGKRWWIQINNLDPNTEYAYQYLVDGSLKIADPYSTKILDPNNDSFIPTTTYPNLKAYPAGKTSGIVSVIQANKPAYNWQINNFQKPKKTDLVIYELLIRDFVEAKNYQTLIDTLSYLKNLGINAIELMPVNEFEGNESWGYNPSFHMAVDKYYGTANKLKEFIDECHKRGIAVIVDVVLNHAFGQNPMVQLYWDAANNRPASNSPWFNPTPSHPFNVGYDFNHESDATKAYSKNVFMYWMSEFKVDGFRFDLSKGFTQKNSGTTDAAVAGWSAYDASRISIWKDYYDAIKAYDSNFYTILEHFADNNEERELSAYGLMFWGNMNHTYNEATMGYIQNSNLSYGIYKDRGWTMPNLVTYMESHDEERLLYKNLTFGNAAGTYSTKDLNTALKRMEQAAAFFFTIPGPKMIWQFGERGYDLSINYPSGTANDRLTNKPPRWEYMQQANRKSLYDVYSKLIKLKIEQPVFETNDFSYSLSGAVKTITLNDPALKVFVVGNFDVQPVSTTVNFPQTGKWFDYLTKDSINITNTNYNYSLAPGEYHVFTSRNLNSTGPNTAIEDNLPENKLYFYNYPNPVIFETTFKYNLLETASVSLKVYDLTGREIETLVNNKQQRGTYEIKWDDNFKYASGQVYLAKLTIGNNSRTIKVLIK